jgi:hypothetical protein
MLNVVAAALMRIQHDRVLVDKPSVSAVVEADYDEAGGYQCV